MPPSRVTFDENGVPPWTRGDFRGVLDAGTDPPRRSATAVAARHPSFGGDFQRNSSCRQGLRHLMKIFDDEYDSLEERLSMSRAHATVAFQPPIRAGMFWIFSSVIVSALMVLVATLPGILKSGKPLVSETNLLFYALVIYFGAAAFYAGYAVLREDVLFRSASRLVWLGFLLHNGAVALRWVSSGRPPVSNIYEMMISFAWGIVLMHLIVERGYRFRFSGLFALPMAALAIIMTMILPSDVRPLMPALQSNLLYIHVGAALFSYAACAISFIIALLFLIKDKARIAGFGVASLESW